MSNRNTTRCIVVALAVSTGVMAGPALGADLNTQKMKIGNSSPSGPTGKIIAKGDFQTFPPSDVFDASASITFRVSDSPFVLDKSVTWAPTDCLTFQTGKVQCQSADKLARAKFTPLNSSPGVFRFKIQVKGLANIHAPYAHPFSLILTHGSTPTLRTDTMDECKTYVFGIICHIL